MPSSMTLCSTQPSSLPAMDTCYLNVGSCGHPEMCREPCLLFQSGKCHRGSSCSFCHREHRRPKKTPKHTHKLLSEMEVGTCLRKLLASMRVRVPSLHFATAAGEFLDTLESQCGGLIGANAAGIRREPVFKQQALVFHTLMFDSMISWFFSKARDHLEPFAVTRIEEAREQLRVAIIASELAADEAASSIQGECNSVCATKSMLRPTETLAADAVALGVEAESECLHQIGLALRPEEWLADDGAALKTKAASPVAFGSWHVAFPRNCNKIDRALLACATESWLVTAGI
eukprot:TRINITY_DN3149_c0_g3_i4.p1 TRINITY_DN3149_c0_g3~~TRINITY_DN3149_c0_g3_i4.p1  ORF type:complete len:289 (-),score=42.04 TRINITY_DN3149_c0_g3_i4:68-934(-)